MRLGAVTPLAWLRAAPAGRSRGGGRRRLRRGRPRPAGVVSESAAPGTLAGEKETGIAGRGEIDGRTGSGAAEARWRRNPSERSGRPAEGTGVQLPGAR